MSESSPDVAVRAADTLSQVLSGPVLLRPLRSLGSHCPDVVIEEKHESTLEISKHPIEQGAIVSDHASRKPDVVTIKGGVGPKMDGEAPGVTFYNLLLELQRSREPFDIITGKRQYKNMLLETLTVTTTESTENSLEFIARCSEVIIVPRRAGSVPPKDRHANPGSTGATRQAGQKQPLEQNGKGKSPPLKLPSGTGDTRKGGTAPGYGG